ncbi:MAG: septum-promoting GTP-binding protein 1 [Alyxoria varia]|nr:MAG: septum-promoting GTP-binding protein 1 [Alyxoria varia]
MDQTNLPLHNQNPAFQQDSHQNDGRPHTSYSDTGFRPYSSHSEAQSPAMSPGADSDPNAQNPLLSGAQQPSRPTSQLSGGQAGQSGHLDPRAGLPPGITGATSGNNKPSSVVIKVGMVGDAQIGKTSLMVKYVEGSWDEDYIQTLGVNFMEKTISIRNTEITFSIWDLGGQREFVNMLPLVCNDAVAILFMFDLTRKSTLNSIKEWYRQGRGFNKTAIPFLVGTKYDHFVNFPREEQEEISNQARRFAKAMKASLIFSSTSHSINVQKIFKIVLSKAFDLRCTIPEIEHVGEPLLLYQSVS